MGVVCSFPSCSRHSLIRSQWVSRQRLGSPPTLAPPTLSPSPIEDLFTTAAGSKQVAYKSKSKKASKTPRPKKGDKEKVSRTNQEFNSNDSETDKVPSAVVIAGLSPARGWGCIRNACEVMHL